MLGFSVKEIEAAALLELEAEAFRLMVDSAKVKILEKRNRPWWRRVFPYRIKLERLPH